jgi:uncharacterized protein (TIGR02284 family)
MALTIDKQIEELNELIRWDIDAVGAYNEAIDAAKEPTIRDPLTQFRKDHQRHIEELSQIVRRIGGKPVEKADLKGIVRKTMTKVAGLVGVESVLRAMKSNEEAVNKAYSHHLSFDWPRDIAEQIRRNFADEQRHLEWVVRTLEARSWEEPTQPMP